MDNPAKTGVTEPVKNAILIAGPTASGKSALALTLARQTGGVIVNTDSMQVYAVLRLLTARPGDDELAAAPHYLYGHVDPRANYSTGRWTDDVQGLVDSGVLAGRTPIFVGGTGLYFKALLQGLSEMPAVPEAVRRKWRDALACDGSAALHQILVTRDPDAATTIRPTDGQRIVRALEVHDASGKPLSHWQQAEGQPLVDGGTARLIVIEPDRAVLANRISRRFDAMMAGGAVEEVRALAALAPDPALPVMKAIGVRELMAVDRGEITMQDATERAKIATRQYAKRQMTWFRNQFGPEWERMSLHD